MNAFILFSASATSWLPLGSVTYGPAGLDEKPSSSSLSSAAGPRFLAGGDAAGAARDIAGVCRVAVSELLVCASCVAVEWSRMRAS